MGTIWIGNLTKPGTIVALCLGSIVLLGCPPSTPDPSCASGQTFSLIRYDNLKNTFASGIIEPLDPADPKLRCYVENDDYGSAMLQFRFSTKNGVITVGDGVSFKVDPHIVFDFNLYPSDVIRYRAVSDCTGNGDKFVNPGTVEGIWVDELSRREISRFDLTPNYQNDTGLIRGKNQYLCFINHSDNLPAQVMFERYRQVNDCTSVPVPHPDWQIAGNEPLPAAFPNGKIVGKCGIYHPSVPPSCPEPGDTFGEHDFCSVCHGSFDETDEHNIYNSCTSTARELVQDEVNNGDNFVCDITEGPCP